MLHKSIIHEVCIKRNISRSSLYAEVSDCQRRIHEH